MRWGFASVDAQVLELVKDVKVGYGSSNSKIIGVLNNRMYFFASRDSINTRELWVTEGTPSTTKMIKQFTPYSQFSTQHETKAVVYHNKLYFIQGDGNSSYDLWESDGTTDGTKSIKQFLALSSYNPYNIVVYNDKLFFIGDELDAHLTIRGLWMSDGTTDGTILLKHISPSTVLTVVNNKLIFNDASTLWATDGTLVGTEMLRSGLDMSSTGDLLIFRDKGYFGCYDNPNNVNATFWITDATVAGTHLLLNGDTTEIFRSPVILTVFMDKLYFAAVDKSNKSALWTTDGSQNGIQKITETDISSTNRATVNDNYFYYINNSIRRLMKSDGTDTGTHIVKDIYVNNPRPVTYHHKIYFCSSELGAGNELWTSDGTDSGTYKFDAPESLDLDGGPLGNSPTFYEFNGSLYFPADYGILGRELWRVRDTSKASVKDPLSDKSISITSQITHDKLHLNFTKPTTITITDILGATISKRMVQARDDIDVSTLSNGTYFIHSDDNGFSTKFLKY